MPKNFEQIYKSIYTDGNSMSFGNTMLRGNGIPLDITCVQKDYDAAVIYAATDAVAYEKQIIGASDANGNITAYIVTTESQGKHTVTVDDVSTEYDVYIKPIGVIPTGDGKTISVTDDGIIALMAKDATVKDADDNDVINAGAQLILQSDGTIKWVQPDTSTAEGQATAIAGLQTNVSTLTSDVAGLKTEDNRLAGLISDNDADIKEVSDALANYYLKTETYSAKEVDNLLSAIPKFAIVVATANAETGLPDVETPSAATVYLIPDNDTKTSDLYDEYIYVNDTWELLGKASIDLSDYAKSADVVSNDTFNSFKTDNTAAINAAVEKGQQGIDDAADALASAQAAQQAAEGAQDTADQAIEDAADAQKTADDNNALIIALQQRASDIEGKNSTQDDAITALQGRATALETDNGKNKEDIADLLGKHNTQQEVIDAINDETTGILALSKSYTDEKIEEANESILALQAKASNTAAGLIQGSENGVSIEDGQVKSISTDLLVNGSETLVLQGGYGIFD